MVLVGTAVWAREKLGLRSTTKNWLWWRCPNWLWQTVPDRCGSCREGTVADGSTQSTRTDKCWRTWKSAVADERQRQRRDDPCVCQSCRFTAQTWQELTKQSKQQNGKIFVTRRKKIKKNIKRNEKDAHTYRPRRTRRTPLIEVWGSSQAVCASVGPVWLWFWTPQYHSVVVVTNATVSLMHLSPS